MIIGIDPAVTKPYAYAIWESGCVVDYGKTHNPAMIPYFMCGKRPFLVIENQYFGGNASTLMKLSQNTGRVMGICDILGLDYRLLAPATWQAHFKLKRRRPKEVSAYKWKKIHANHIIKKAIEVSGITTIKDDDIASAILIGLYYMEEREE